MDVLRELKTWRDANHGQRDIFCNVRLYGNMLDIAARRDDVELTAWVVSWRSPKFAVCMCQRRAVRIALECVSPPQEVI